MPAVRRTRAVKLFWALHKWIYQTSGGRIGARLFGNPVLILHTKGRKSGKPRSNVLMYVPDGRAYVVVATNAGADFHPAWWLNLREREEGEIQAGRKRMRVHAQEAEGKERARLWARIVEADESYREYEIRTARKIPVVVLEPLEQA